MAGISTIFSLTSANDDREVCLDLTEKVFLLSYQLCVGIQFADRAGNKLWNNALGYHV